MSSHHAPAGSPAAGLRATPTIARSVVAKHGLPAFIAYGALIGEVVVPLFVILGLSTRPVAPVIAINMLFAIGLAHRGQVFRLGKHGGRALKLQAFYLFGAIATRCSARGA